jgi:hypothetical protein
MKKRKKNGLNTKASRRPAPNNDTCRNLCQKSESVEFTQAENPFLTDIAECQCLIIKAFSLNYKTLAGPTPNKRFTMKRKKYKNKSIRTKYIQKGSTMKKRKKNELTLMTSQRLVFSSDISWSLYRTKSSIVNITIYNPEMP